MKVHALYAIISIIIVLCIDYTNHSPFGFHNDFVQYWASGKIILDGQINDLYRLYDDTPYQIIQVVYNTSFFRYLPTAAFIFVPFALVPYNISYCFYIIICVLLNFKTSTYIDRIIKIINGDSEKVNKYARLCSSLYLIFPFHIDVFIEGQISPLIAFTIIFSLLKLLGNEEKKAFLVLGLSFCIKPVAYLIIIYMLIVAKSLKKMVKRCILILAPISLNLIIFAIFPEIMRNFIQTNLTDIGFSPSLSLTSALSIFIGNKIYIMLIGLIIFFISFFIVKRNILVLEKDIIVFAYIFGIFAIFIFQADIWASQTIYLLPFIFLLNMDVDLIKKEFLKTTIILCIVISILFPPLFKMVAWIPSIYFSYILLKNIKINEKRTLLCTGTG